MGPWIRFYSYCRGQWPVGQNSPTSGQSRAKADLLSPLQESSGPCSDIRAVYPVAAVWGCFIGELTLGTPSLGSHHANKELKHVCFVWLIWRLLIGQLEVYAKWLLSHRKASTMTLFYRIENGSLQKPKVIQFVNFMPSFEPDSVAPKPMYPKPQTLLGCLSGCFFCYFFCPNSVSVVSSSYPNT